MTVVVYDHFTCRLLASLLSRWRQAYWKTAPHPQRGEHGKSGLLQLYMPVVPTYWLYAPLDVTITRLMFIPLDRCFNLLAFPGHDTFS